MANIKEGVSSEREEGRETHWTGVAEKPSPWRWGRSTQEEMW
jgi:hypothetical protein